MSAPWPHIPVLLRETVAALAPRSGELFVDCTLGAGGHTEALLESAECHVIGLDRDVDALAIARARLARFGERFRAVHGSFGDFADILDKEGVDGVDGVLADLGVSSLQLDTAERGFSFRFAGPVDMRMDTSAPSSAADLVNHWSEAALAKCISELGEERYASRVASAIVRGRPWSDTLSLASAIAGAVPGGRHARIHPATRTFQALRMAVNDELGQLQRLLPAAVERLRPGGRVAIISFHSLEDRVVKHFFARESGKDAPRDPFGNRLGNPRLKVPGPSVTASQPDPTGDPLAPLVSPPEAINPRARSARLRLAVRS